MKWTPAVALALALALSLSLIRVTACSAETGSLTLANVRSTHGLLGPTRADGKIVPGDALFVCFEIKGITVAADGKVSYSIATEVANAAGRVQFRQDPKSVELPTSLGGSSLPAFARVDVGLETAPGAYTVKVTVADKASGASKELTQSFEVAPKSFSLVRLTITNDPQGQLPAAVLGVGQAAWLQVGAVGFTKPAAGKAPAVAFTLKILDEAGKPTLTKPVEVPPNKDGDGTMLLVPVQFFLSLNRPGKFTAEITATDESAKKTTSLTVPLTVLPTH